MAPRVPVPAGQTQTLAPIGRSFQNINPRVQANVPLVAFGGGGPLQATQQQATQNAQLTAAISERAIRQMDAVAHSEATLAENEARGRAMARINGAQGRDAFGALTEAIEEYDLELEKISGGLANERQRARFNVEAIRRREALRQSGHLQTEKKIFEHSENRLTAFLEAEVASVVEASRIGNPRQVNIHRISIDGGIDALADLKGWSDEETASRRKGILSAMHRSIIAGMVSNGRSAVAKEYLDSKDVRKEMNLGDIQFSENSVKGASLAELAQSTTELAISRFGDDDVAGKAWIRRNNSGSEEEALLRHYNDRINENRAVATKRENDNQEKFFSLQLDNPTAPLHVIEQLSGVKVASLSSSARIKAQSRRSKALKSASTGARRRENLAPYVDLVEKHIRDPRSVARMPRGEILKIAESTGTKSGFNKVISIWKESAGDVERADIKSAQRLVPRESEISGELINTLSRMGIKRGSKGSKREKRFMAAASDYRAFIDRNQPKNFDELKTQSREWELVKTKEMFKTVPELDERGLPITDMRLGGLIGSMRKRQSFVSGVAPEKFVIDITSLLRKFGHRQPPDQDFIDKIYAIGVVSDFSARGSNRATQANKLYKEALETGFIPPETDKLLSEFAKKGK